MSLRAAPPPPTASRASRPARCVAGRCDRRRPGSCRRDDHRGTGCSPSRRLQRPTASARRSDRPPAAWRRARGQPARRPRSRRGSDSRARETPNRSRTRLPGRGRSRSTSGPAPPWLVCHLAPGRCRQHETRRPSRPAPAPGPRHARPHRRRRRPMPSRRRSQPRPRPGPPDPSLDAPPLAPLSHRARPPRRTPR